MGCPETVGGSGSEPPPEEIVLRSLPAVGENGVGLIEALHALRRFRIPAVPVGVVLQGQPAIAVLDLLFRSVFTDFQDFVVVDGVTSSP